MINRAPDIPIEDIPEESDVTEEAFDFTLSHYFKNLSIKSCSLRMGIPSSAAFLFFEDAE